MALIKSDGYVATYVILSIFDDHRNLIMSIGLLPRNFGLVEFYSVGQSMYSIELVQNFKKPAENGNF